MENVVKADVIIMMILIARFVLIVKLDTIKLTSSAFNVQIIARPVYQTHYVIHVNKTFHSLNLMNVV